MMMEVQMYINESEQNVSIWLKRLGWLGGLFFLVKGVVWLTLPLLFFYMETGS